VLRVVIIDDEVGTAADPMLLFWAPPSGIAQPPPWVIFREKFITSWTRSRLDEVFAYFSG
jgi:hypothetical protein